MSEQNERTGVQLTIHNVRHCYTHLYEMYKGKLSTVAKYKDTFLIVPNSEADKAIRAAISKSAGIAWGTEIVPGQLHPVTKQPLTKAQVMVLAFKDNKMKFPYRDGNLPDDNGNVNPQTQGFWTLTANSTVQPTLLDENNNDISGLNKNGDKLYPGAIVTASLEIWCQKGSEKAGVRCALRGVRHNADGERLTGGASKAAVDEFGPPPGNPDSDDDIVGGNPDNDIPF